MDSLNQNERPDNLKRSMELVDELRTTLKALAVEWQGDQPAEEAIADAAETMNRVAFELNYLTKCIRDVY